MSEYLKEQIGSHLVIPRKQRLTQICSRLDSDLTDMKTCQESPQVITAHQQQWSSILTFPELWRACLDHPLWQRKSCSTNKVDTAMTKNKKGAFTP